MNDSRPDRFRPAPRRAATARTDHDERNLIDELSRILRRLDAVAASERADFSDGSPSYDAASMAVIRMAALLEGSHDLPARLSDDEARGIRAMRNIAAHGGYVVMDDDVLWRAVTEQLPQIVRRLVDDYSGHSRRSSSR